MKTASEVRELFEKGDVRGFNKEMSKRVPHKNGCVDLGDIVSEFEAIQNPILVDEKDGIAVIEIRDKTLLGKDISFQDIPKTDRFKRWLESQ